MNPASPSGFGLHRLAPLVLAFGAAWVVALAPTLAHAQAKKQVKISHATAADVANDNHMVAWILANHINSNSDTLEARIYPANQLGEERAVVEGMQLGAGATIHVGGTAIHNNFNKRMGVPPQFNLPKFGKAAEEKK